MGKLIGAVLAAAGVAIGAYALYSHTFQDDTIVVTLPPSPAHVLATAQVGTSHLARPPASDTGRLPARAAWEGTVTPVPRVPASDIRSSSSAAPPRIPVGWQATTIEAPIDHMGLARELQRQLKRVGCYEGDINGVWTPSARRAMKAFIDRVNATLPIEQPDFILLAIVQNHQGQACGTSCPAGQALAADGRCLPSAIIARAAKKPAPVDNSNSGSFAAVAVAPSDGAVPIAPGRMGLAGPQPEPSPLVTDARAPGPYLSPQDVAAQDGPPVRSARPPTNFDARARERRRERGWVQRAFPSSMY